MEQFRDRRNGFASNVFSYVSVQKKERAIEVYQKKYDISSKEGGKAEADIKRHEDMKATMLVLVVGAFA